MKIRNGFVSNSSSSSFVIYGVCLDEKKIFEMAKDTFYDLSDMDKDDLEDLDAYELLNELLQLELYKDLFFASDGDGRYYVGASYTDFKDDETYLEFKDRIKQNLIDLTGDISVYEDAKWYEEVVYD